MDYSTLKQLDPTFSPDESSKHFVCAIVKVSQPGYRPRGLNVRADISDCIFTADIPNLLIPILEQDELVLQVSPATAVYPAA